MKRKIIILCILILIGFPPLQGQDELASLGPWHLRYVSGEVSLQNLFRLQKSLFKDIEEKQNSLYFIGGLKLDLNSYLWQPDLASFRISGEYNPETRDEKYLLIPDRSEVRTLKKLDLQASIFSGKPVSLIAWANLNQNYYNRELLTNIRSNNRRWGGTLSLNNNIVPLSITYRNTYWDQLETQTGRNFIMEQDNMQAVIKKSFTQNDNNEILYSHENYNYTYSDLHNNSNVIDRFRLDNNIYFSSLRRHSFNSSILYYKQEGYLEFNKLEANERLVLNLPHNIRISSNYNFNRLDNADYLLTRHRAVGNLNHRLYESLNTDLNIEYSTVSHDLYDEKNLKVGGRILYTKKILSHRLNLGYHYYRHYMDMESEPTDIIINNEEHTLSDSEITYLDKPYVNQSSVSVKDFTGTFIYQLGIDYLLEEINNFTEIRRIPGGLIADNQSVLVDYIVVQPGSYGFTSAYNNLSASMMFFNNLIEIYYRGYIQDYKKVRETEFLVLNYYTRNVYGFRINIDFATAGIEYDLYRSNIIPYERTNYYLNLSRSIKDKIALSLNCNIRDYRIIDNEVNHKYFNASARASYKMSARTRLALDLGYLKQKGRNIDLDLLTGRVEFQTSIRQLHLKGGIQRYIRHYLDNKYSFYGTYIEIARKF